MKKRYVLVLIVMSMMLMSVVASYAGYTPEKVKIKIGKNELLLEKIDVLINGEKLNSDVPPVLYKSTTLVPVRFISEYLNAVVKWDNAEKKVSIKNDGMDIVLKIDSKEVWVNGSKKTLPSNTPAVLMNDRTMVPLRFAAEELGFKVDWDSTLRRGLISSEPSKVVGVSVDASDNMPRVVIKGTDKLYYKTSYMENPSRLILDINNSTMGIGYDKLDENQAFNKKVNQYPLKDISVFQLSTKPDVTRVVFNLERTTGMKVNSGSDGKSLNIDFSNIMENLYEKDINGRKAIVIDSSSRPLFNTMRLTGPNRFVVDMMDSLVGNVENAYNFNVGETKRVRLSQFSPEGMYDSQDKIVRLVFDLDDDIKDSNLVLNQIGDKMYFYSDDKLLKGLSFNANNGVLDIKSNKAKNYKQEYDKQSNSVILNIPEYCDEIGKSVATLRQNEYVKNISLDQGEEKNIRVQLKDGVTYTLSSTASNLKMSFKKKNIKNNSQFTVVIDAGHGGHDPGAISPINGVKEKDLNLLTALAVEKNLKALGFNVIMTRSTDVFVNLYERAYIANRNDADLFVSIHHNYNNDKNIKGIQTLYCPSYKSQVKQNDQYPFAAYMHNSLLSGMDVIDKRIERRPGLVVTRETKMDAVLLELGFLSNSQEVKKLCTDSYRQKMAKVIADALANRLVK